MIVNLSYHGFDHGPNYRPPGPLFLVAQILNTGTVPVCNDDDAATTMGLHTSWEKTKLQNIGHGPPPQSVSVDGHPVVITDKFDYLVSIVDSTGYSSTDILRRVGLAS